MCIWLAKLMLILLYDYKNWKQMLCLIYLCFISGLRYQAMYLVKKSGISNYAYNLNVSMNGKLMIYLS